MSSSDDAGGAAGRAGEQGRRRAWVRFTPIVVFVVIAAVFAYEIIAGNNTSDLPSALLNDPAPEFDMPPLEGLARGGEQVPGFATADLRGQVTVVNVFASWCVPCRQEHPFIEELGEDDRFALFGINHTDQPPAALEFLRDYGNPYDRVGVDPRQRVSIDWGVYGVPETFLLDREGVIRHKVIGPIDEERLQDEVLPILEELLAETPEA